MSLEMRSFKFILRKDDGMLRWNKHFSISKQIPSLTNLLKIAKSKHLKRHKLEKAYCNLYIEYTNGRKVANFERYASYNPSPLSLQQLLNFGRSISYKQSLPNVFFVCFFLWIHSYLNELPECCKLAKPSWSSLSAVLLATWMAPNTRGWAHVSLDSFNP